MPSNNNVNKNQHNSNANKGFASMDSEKQREIASKGGKAAHDKGTGHQSNGRETGKKGGTHSSGGHR